jgi:hypothetical protein
MDPESAGLLKRAAPAAAAAAAAVGADAWSVDPYRPLSRTSRWWRVLAVARRFAAADMSYEVEDLRPAVGRAITQTCTEAFAAELAAMGVL